MRKEQSSLIKEEIIKMVSKMNNNKLLETLYGFVVIFYKREMGAN